MSEVEHKNTEIIVKFPKHQCFGNMVIGDYFLESFFEDIFVPCVKISEELAMNLHPGWRDEMFGATKVFQLEGRHMVMSARLSITAEMVAATDREFYDENGMEAE
jgi:hypothetical protein